MRKVLLASMIFLSVSYGADDWGAAQFLVGRWIGEGGGEPGNGAGSFSFTPDLQGKILIRKNVAEYPPANGKPAYRHDDLMIVYHKDVSRELGAIYFDNEGHVIQYSVKASAEGVVFVSESAQNATRFRLTYTKAGKDQLNLKFEIAAPGKDFAPYIQAGAHRDDRPN